MVDAPPRWHAYALLSDGGTRTYAGATVRPAWRLRAHNGEVCGGARATRTGRPWRYLFRVDGFRTQRVALQFEARLKSRRSRSGGSGPVGRRVGLLRRALAWHGGTDDPEPLVVVFSADAWVADIHSSKRNDVHLFTLDVT